MKRITAIITAVLAAILLLAAQAKPKPGAGQTATLTLTDYGADPSGTKDSSPAFKRLFAAMGERKNAEVFIPAGKYRITERVVFNQPQFAGYSESSGLSFRGAGEDATELVCDNPDGGFYFNAGTNLITVTVSDMSFVAVRKGEGTAIEFDTAGQNAGDHHSRMFQARNILIRGKTFNDGWFKNGVVVKNAWYPILENVKVTAEYGTDKAGKMNDGFLLENCYSPYVDKCYFWGPADFGLRYISSINGEDGIISGCYFVGQDVGIYVQLSSRTDGWGEPALHVSDSHIHYLKKGLAVKGVRQGFITGNLFYCFNKNGSRWWNDQNKASDFESKDVELDASNDFIISGNQFTEPASPKRICIDIMPSSGNILISNNIFNMDGTAIRNRSETTSRCMGNVFEGTPAFTTSNGKTVIIPYVDEHGTLKKIDFN